MQVVFQPSQPLTGHPGAENTAGTAIHGSPGTSNLEKKKTEEINVPMSRQLQK
jgi:hypothetical protein